MAQYKGGDAKALCKALREKYSGKKNSSKHTTQFNFYTTVYSLLSSLATSVRFN
jgi:hypothetical protein